MFSETLINESTSIDLKNCLVYKVRSSEIDLTVTVSFFNTSLTF